MYVPIMNLIITLDHHFKPNTYIKIVIPMVGMFEPILPQINILHTTVTMEDILQLRKIYYTLNVHLNCICVLWQYVF